MASLGLLQVEAVLDLVMLSLRPNQTDVSFIANRSMCVVPEYALSLVYGRPFSQAP